jgi:hypothetical protein
VVHHHSVRGIRKLTQFAHVAVVLASISKQEFVLHADTQQLVLANVDDVVSSDGWSKKVQQRKGTGTGRMRYLKTIPRVFKNQIKGLAK